MEQLSRIQGIRVLVSWAFALALLACSHAASPELVDARRAYDRAEDGPARTQRPGELHTAKQALDRAEAAHDDHPGSKHEKRLAEVAEHRAEVADARGEAAQAELIAQAQRKRANRAASELRPQEPRASVAKVDREPLKDDADRGEPRRAEDVDNSLQNLIQGSTVREDVRGTVIIMSGALLFESGKDKLSDTAEQHLTQVAEALKKQPARTHFRVEGYTDSTGSELRNEELSTSRARAVGSYLEHAGIDQDRIECVGYGEARPLAGNDSDEGRASNRRIEIVLLPNNS